MAISINWGTKVIYVPQSFLTFLSGDRWRLDVNEFRLALKDIEDSEEGSVFPDTHRHNTAVTLSGVTYARTFEIINGYTVEFEDKGAHYTVVCVGANHNLGDVIVPGPTHLIIGNAAGLIVAETGVSGLTPSESDALLGIQADIDAMQPDVASLESNVGTIQSNVSAIQSDVGTIQSDVTAIEGAVSTINVNVGLIQADLAAAVADIATIEGDHALIRAFESGRWRVDGTGVMTFYDEDGVTAYKQFQLKDVAGVNVANPALAYERAPL